MDGGGGGVGVIARDVTSHSSGKSISLGISLTMLKSVLLGWSRVFSSMRTLSFSRVAIKEMPLSPRGEQ